jgi:hypothetical protein
MNELEKELQNIDSRSEGEIPHQDDFGNTLFTRSLEDMLILEDYTRVTNTTRSKLKKGLNPLRKFIKVPKNPSLDVFSGKIKANYPKKEYYILGIIRKFQKAFESGMEFFKKQNILKVRNLYMYFQKYHDIFEIKNKILLRPVQDKKKTTTPEQICTSCQSYNNAFILIYLGDEIVKEGFFYFVDYMYTISESRSLQELKERFKFNCCNRIRCSKECAIKWKELKYATKTSLIGNFDEDS